VRSWRVKASGRGGRALHLRRADGQLPWQDRGVSREAPSLLTRLRKAFGAVMIGFGAVVIALGLAYWWKDWALARLVLGLGCAAGLGLVGGGVLVSWPTSAAGCLSAALCLLSSGGLFFVMSLLQPLLPALPLVAGAVAALGAVSYVGYLFHRRRPPPAPPPASPPTGTR
jgi:hypothetical protein